MFGFEGENAREKGIVLLTMCFALAMAMLDNTVVNVAVPSIQKDLSAGFSQLQWIVDAYVLAFASLLLTGGILGDRYGRKRMFLGGLAIFTLLSLLCGLANTPTQLITARAFQGIGGALLIPGTLSIITVTFPPHERAKALGLWAGVSASRSRSGRRSVATWSSTSGGSPSSSSTCRSASSRSSSRSSRSANPVPSRSGSSTWPG
jgi:MFS family permease